MYNPNSEYVKHIFAVIASETGTTDILVQAQRGRVTSDGVRAVVDWTAVPEDNCTHERQSNGQQLPLFAAIVFQTTF